MKLYLDCASGIAGDMFLAAMIDLGLKAKELEAALKKVVPGRWSLDVQGVGSPGTELEFAL